MRPAILGALTALYLLSGRWALTRLSGGERAFYYEVRLWVVALLAAAAFLATRVPERPRGRGAVGWLAAFLAWAIVSAAWGPDGDLALRKAYEAALVLVATVSLARILASDAAPRARWWFWATVLALGGVMSALALPSVVASGAAGERLSVLAGGPNVFARIVGLMAIGALFLWRRHGRPWLFMPVVAGAFVLVLLTGSRGGLVSLGIAVAVFVVLHVRDARRLLPAVAVAAGLFFVGARYTGPGQAALRSYDRRVKILLVAERYTGGREVLYRDAWRLGMESPVLGRGLAAFPASGRGVYPHNLFLEAFCETGVVGVALLVAGLAAGVAAVWRRAGPRDGAAVAAFVLLLVSSQFSGDLYDSRGVLALLVAAIAAPAPRAEDGLALAPEEEDATGT